MADSDTGPAEREVMNLRFQQLTRLKIFDDKPETLTPKERRQLLAVSNRYGYTFAGCDSGLKILKTSTINEIHDKHQDSPNNVVDDYKCMRVALSAQPVHLALNGDDLILSVCCTADDGLLVALFDVRTLVHKSINAAPFAMETLSKGSDAQLVNLLWNPTNLTYFATCLSDGRMALWDCSGEGIRLVAPLPSDVEPTAMCWSPKGKQVVVGTSTGKLIQFDQAMERKKVIPAADFTAEPIKVVDILWLSTYMFAVAYIDAEETLQPNLAIVTSPKEGRPTFANYDDICYGMGESRTAQYQLLNLDKMGFIVALSSNSTEAAVIGRSPSNRALWEIWTLDDAARVAVPLSANDEDAYPMGMALDLTSEAAVKIGTTTYHPPPIVMVLSTEGLLCPFYVLDSDAKEAITAKAQPLPVEGGRVGKLGPSQAAVMKPVAPSATADQASVFTATLPIHKSSSTGSFSFGSSNSSSSTPSALGTTPVPGPAAERSSSFSVAPKAAAAQQPPSGGGAAPGFAPGGLAGPFTFGSKGDGGAKPGVAAAPFLPAKASPAGTALAPAQGVAPFQVKALGVPEAGQPAQPSPHAAPVALHPSAAPSSSSAFSFSQQKSPVDPPSVFASGLQQTDSAKIANSLPALKQAQFGQQPSVQPLPSKAPPGHAQPSAQAPPLAHQAQPSPFAAPPSSLTTGAAPPNQVAPPRSGFVPPGQPPPHSGFPAPGPASRAPPPAYATPAVQPPRQAMPETRPPPSVPAPRSAETTPGGGSRPGGVGSFTGTPVEAAYLSNLSEEIEHFGKELAELRSHTLRAHFSVGDSAEHERMKKSTDTLVKFRAEVLDVTKSHNEEIHELKSKLLATFAQLEDARVLRQRNSDPRYLHLLRLRALDPQTAQQLRTIRSNRHYLETGLGDVNGCLDAQWEEFHQRKSRREGRKLGTPTMDTIYQTLSHHYNIMISQRGKLEELRQALIQARRYDIIKAPWERGMLSPPSRSGDLSSLSAQLSSTQITSPAKATGTPVSSKKQAQLRKALSRRATTPRRTISRVDISDFGSPAPSHGSRDNLFPAFANRRLQYRDEETDSHRPATASGQATEAPESPGVRMAAGGIGQARPGGEGVAESAGPPSRLPEGTGAQISGAIELRQTPAVSASAPPVPNAVAPPSSGHALPLAATTSPSSFTHSGRGTVVWGVQTTPAKPQSSARAPTTQRKSSERQPELPPVVNIKNLDIKEEAHMPPVTFAPANNTVDAGTVKVVKEVLAEITKASRYGQSDHAGPGTERKISFSDEPPSVAQPIPPSTALASKTAGPTSFSFAAASKIPSVQPLPANTSAIPPAATSSGPAFGASAANSAPKFGTAAAPSSAPVFGAPATNSGSVFGAFATKPGPAFGASAANAGPTFGASGAAFGPSSAASTSGPLFGGSIFGAREDGVSAPPNATAQGLPSDFTFAAAQQGDTPAASATGTSTQPVAPSNVAAAAKPMFEAPVSGASASVGSSGFSLAAASQQSTSIPSVQASSGDTAGGVKPSLFAFKDQQSAASASTPGGLFMAPAAAKPASEPSRGDLPSGASAVVTPAAHGQLPFTATAPPAKPGLGVTPTAPALPSAPAGSVAGQGDSQASAKPATEAGAKPSTGSGNGTSGLKQLLAEDEAGTGLASKPSFSGFGASAAAPRPVGEDEAGSGRPAATMDTKDHPAGAMTAPSPAAAATGLFGTPAAPTADGSTGGAFGVKTEVSGPFGTSTSSAAGATATSGTTGGFGAPSFGANPSVGLFGAPKFGASPASTGFGSAAPATTTTAVTAAEPSKPKAPTTLFSLLKEDDPVPSSTVAGSSPFGAAAPSSTAGKSLFSQAPSSTSASPFGQAPSSMSASPFGQAPSSTSASPFGQAPSSTSASPFGQSGGAPGGLFSQPASSAPSSGGLFGKPAATSSGGGQFGQPTAADGTDSMFGQAAVATSTGGLFGKGSPAPAPASSGGPFGASASSPAFGQQSTGAFGSSSTAAPPAFGQGPSLFSQSGTSEPSTSSVFGSPSGNDGGGFFSGLGSRPDPDAARTNPFGTPAVTSSAFGSPATGSATIFGGQVAETFGSGSSNTGSVFGGGGSFSSPGAGVAKSGFGGFNQPTGAASSGFGSPPSFGSPPAFGSTPAFGGGAAFGSPAAPTLFGQPPAFGASTSQASGGMAGGGMAGGFSGFAAQETPTFGALSGAGDKTTQSGFGGFGTGTPQPGFGGFGNSGGSSNPSGGFSGSSSFTQYR